MKERAQNSFDVQEMIDFLNGGPAGTKIRRDIMTELENDPNFDMKDIFDLNRHEIRERNYKRV